MKQQRRVSSESNVYYKCTSHSSLNYSVLENSSFMHHLKVKTRSQSSEKRLLSYSCVFVCPSVWNNSAPNGRILMREIYIAVLFENLSRKFNLY
jgi:hypothetical protein